MVEAEVHSNLPKEEQVHFYKCTTCGEMVNKRQLDEVLFHEDHLPRPDIQYGGSQRIEKEDT